MTTILEKTTGLVAFVRTVELDSFGAARLLVRSAGRERSGRFHQRCVPRCAYRHHQCTREVAITRPSTVITRGGFASTPMGCSGPGKFIGFSAVALVLLYWKRDLGVQKPCYVRHKQRGILAMRAVVGIGIKDKLRIGQVLLKDGRIHEIDEYVIASIDHQPVGRSPGDSRRRRRAARPISRAPRVGRARPLPRLRDRDAPCVDGIVSGKPGRQPGFSQTE
jgi:hypothetical protein